jgi:hypothetical protein
MFVVVASAGIGSRGLIDVDTGSSNFVGKWFSHIGCRLGLLGRFMVAIVAIVRVAVTRATSLRELRLITGLIL